MAGTISSAEVSNLKTRVLRELALSSDTSELLTRAGEFNFTETLPLIDLLLKIHEHAEVDPTQHESLFLYADKNLITYLTFLAVHDEHFAKLENIAKAVAEEVEQQNQLSEKEATQKVVTPAEFLRDFKEKVVSQVLRNIVAGHTRYGIELYIARMGFSTEEVFREISKLSQIEDVKENLADVKTWAQEHWYEAEAPVEIKPVVVKPEKTPVIMQPMMEVKPNGRDNGHQEVDWTRRPNDFYIYVDLKPTETNYTLDSVENAVACHLQPGEDQLSSTIKDGRVTITKLLNGKSEGKTNILVETVDPRNKVGKRRYHYTIEFVGGGEAKKKEEPQRRRPKNPEVKTEPAPVVETPVVAATTQPVVIETTTPQVEFHSIEGNIEKVWEATKRMWSPMTINKIWGISEKEIEEIYDKLLTQFGLQPTEKVKLRRITKAFDAYQAASAATAEEINEILSQSIWTEEKGTDQPYITPRYSRSVSVPNRGSIPLPQHKSISIK